MEARIDSVVKVSGRGRQHIFAGAVALPGSHFFSRTIVLSALAAILLSPVVPSGQRSAAATSQQDGTWSTPVLLFQSEASVRQVATIADAMGRLHVFWQASQFPQGAPEQGLELIYYAIKDGDRWTKPVDIVAAPSASLAGATVDQARIAHLLWLGASNQLNYSRATARQATSARDWAAPVPVAQVSDYAQQIVADDQGTLHLAYAGTGAAGPFYQSSRDGGRTWSFPTHVATTATPKSSADWVRIAVSASGTIHVVWTEYQLPGGWPPLGVYYSRSRDGGRTWSEPVQLAGEGFDMASVAVGKGDEVHVAWDSTAKRGEIVTPGGRFHRWSADGGSSWSETGTIMTYGLSEGTPQLAMDSTGTMHIITSAAGRVWHSAWRGQRWDPAEYVPSGDEAGVPPLAETAEGMRDVEGPAMAITGGGRLNVVFSDHRYQQNRWYLWYTSKDVAPLVTPPTPTPTPTPVVSLTPTEQTRTSAPNLSPTPHTAVRAVIADEPDPAAPTSPQSSVLLSLWPVVAVVGGVFVARLIHQKKR